MKVIGVKALQNQVVANKMTAVKEEGTLEKTRGFTSSKGLQANLSTRMTPVDNIDTSRIDLVQTSTRNATPAGLSKVQSPAVLNRDFKDETIIGIPL